MADEFAPGHSRHVPPGATRDCVDPWIYVELKVSGDVAPCCVRPPIGNIRTDTLANILISENARLVRRRLLEGDLDRPCQTCGLRAPIPVDALQAKVRGLLEAMTLPDGFDRDAYLAANPDVAEAGKDPEQHFRTFGRLEGRKLRS